MKANIPQWRDVPLPAPVKAAQTMLMEKEQQLLYTLARDYFRGFGHIVDAGCFLGGSTLALAYGVLDNPACKRHPRTDLIHSYDLFVVEPWTIGVYFDQGTPPGTSFEPIFRQNIAAVAHLVDTRPGNVTAQLPFTDPIEILFIDLAKYWTVSDHLVRAFFPALVPGHSVVIQQDYLYPTRTGWLPVTMEYLSEYFEIIDHTQEKSVLFFYRKQIPEEILQVNIIQSLTLSAVKDLAERAIARFDGKQRKILEQSCSEFIGMLTALPYDSLMAIQNGSLAYHYKGTPMLKNPFDLALYSLLLWQLKPRSIIEIGSNAGGSAVWLADQLLAFGVDGRVFSVDINVVTNIRDPRVTFLVGDGRQIDKTFPASMVEGLPRPLLIIEDADHMYETTKAVLDYFAPLMNIGEYIVVEDGILTAMKVDDQYNGGPARAIVEFLGRNQPSWTVDRSYCDFFGHNTTWNVNGYLKRVQ